MEKTIFLLKQSIHEINERITFQLSKENPNKKYCEFLNTTRNRLIDAVDLIETIISEQGKKTAPLIDIIKKQALIIDLSGIQYPTINQSMGHIMDLYLNKQGRTELIGNHNVDLPVTIHII